MKMKKKLVYVIGFRWNSKDQWFIHPATGEVIRNFTDLLYLIRR